MSKIILEFKNCLCSDNIHEPLCPRDRPEVQAVFKPFKIPPVSTTYPVNGQNQCQAKDLVIRNF
jgi:hypothetical protein